MATPLKRPLMAPCIPWVYVCIPSDMKGQRPLTEKQKAVLSYFRERADLGERPPSYRELMRHFGWRSPRSAQKVVKVLAARGQLAIDHLQPNGVHLPHLDKGAVGTVPHVESLSANGKPRKVLQEIPLPVQLHPGDPSFAFNVGDDSLAKSGFRSHDLVIARGGQEPREGDFVVLVEAGTPRVSSVQSARGKMIAGVVKVLIRAFDPDRG